MYKSLHLICDYPIRQQCIQNMETVMCFIFKNRCESCLRPLLTIWLMVSHLTSQSLILKRSQSVITQSCPSLCKPLNYSLPGSSVHGISQARILAWVAISSSRWSSCPRHQTQVCCLAGRFFTIWATRKVQASFYLLINLEL